MDIVRVESSLSDGSYVLVPDAAEEAQPEEVVHALIAEDPTDFANPPQQGKHRSITQFSNSASIYGCSYVCAFTFRS